MAKLTNILTISFILFFVVANSQGDIEDGESGFQDQGIDGDQPHYTDDQQETIIQRNKLIACIILSRHKFNDINDELGIVLKQSSASQSLYKKMLGDFMLHCFFTIRTDESEKLFDDIQNKKLELENWEHLHNFNLDRYKGTVELELSPEQERLVELVEEFDKQMREKYGEQQQSTEEDQDIYAKKNIDIEPKIGGISMKNTPATFRYIYIGAIFALVGLGLYIALKRLFNPEVTPYEKAQLEKKEKRKTKKSQ